MTRTFIINATVTFTGRLAPLPIEWPDEPIIADTNVALTPDQRVALLNAISKPTARASEPLPFDPDDGVPW